MKTASRFLQSIACLWLALGFSLPALGGPLLNSYRFPSGGVTDPYFANVVLLLHCNGANAGTTFTDSSSYARSMTAVGNAQTSTAVYKYGTASFLGDGNDYVSAADAAELELGSGDFTIECFCNVSSTSAITILSKWDGNGRQSWFLGGGTAGYGFYISLNGTAATLALPLTSWPSTSTWFYIAVTRAGADLKLWINGTQQGSTYNIGTSTLFDSTSILTIGDDANVNPGFIGSIDEIRITKGVARDVSTIPAAAFPDS